jgi:signal recognition particle subunit SEC65
MTWESEPRPNIKEMKKTLDDLELKIKDHKHCLYGEVWMKERDEKKLTIEAVEVLTKTVSDILYYISH